MQNTGPVPFDCADRNGNGNTKNDVMRDAMTRNSMITSFKQWMVMKFVGVVLISERKFDAMTVKMDYEKNKKRIKIETKYMESYLNWIEYC